jgi:AraC-like DNA-binding protein
MHLSAYGMYGYALLSSVTMREFFDLGVKFHRLATPTLSIQWREDPDAAVWFFPEQFITAPTPELRRFLLEQQFAQHVTHMKDCIGAECTPIKVFASYPAPDHSDLYPRFLGCPVDFDRSVCELYYPLSVLDRSPQLSHRLTSKILQETCGRLIGSAKISTGVAGETYQILIRTPGHFPGMEEVAEALHMTTRTLRRKLEAEDTSFAEIFSDVRRSLATEYLQTTRMKTEDISALLGFSDAANFRHAFKRWTGKTPGDFRQRHA